MPEENAAHRRRAPGLLAPLAALYRLLSPRRRRHLHLSILLMVLGAVAELVTIGAVLPFLALISNSAAPSASGHAGTALSLLGWEDGRAAVVPAALLLCGAAMVSGALRVLLGWVSSSFVFGFGHELAVRIHSRLLRQPYVAHIQRNSSVAIAAVEKVQHSIVAVIQPAMQGAVSLVMATFIIALLIAIDPRTASVSAGAVVLLYAGMTFVTQKSLHRSSGDVSDAQSARIKLLQENLGGIRDILLDRSQPIFEKSFKEIDGRLRHGQLLANFLTTLPRVVIESGAIILIAVLALYMSRQPGGLVAAIPVLGAFAIGAQRLLPLLQAIYAGVSRTAASSHMIGEIVAMAESPIMADASPSTVPRALQKEIVLRDVAFRYPGERGPSLRRLDLVITAGERVGVIGETGSGKSTLLDLLMGLLEPSAGEILIDGVRLDDATRADWQAGIAHVPQFIYLADSSIAENIAFGIAPDLIDLARIRAAAAEAQLTRFVETLPDGYATRVGERGVRLSGGQRQRLGIARALYKQPSVLILDEATSALDNETEAAVMAALSSGGRRRTVLIVAHRLTSLASCDRLVRLHEGAIVEEGSFESIVGERARKHAS